MKVKNVKFTKCFNLGNYQNEVIGIEIEPEEGERAEDVIKQAKLFVERESQKFVKDLEQAKLVVSNEDRFITGVVKSAKALIDSSEAELPF